MQSHLPETQYASVAARLDYGAVLPYDAHGARVWIKKAGRSKVTVWHHLQIALSMVIPSPILRPTASRGGATVLHGEAGRFRVFAQKGFYVPAILEQGNDYIVSADMQCDIKTYFKHIPVEERRTQCLPVLRKAVCELARLHDAGLVHGRPYLRDLVYDPDGDRIGFLDLEENPLDVMAFDHACARDIWLFLCSAVPYTGEDSQVIEGLYRTYLQSREIAGLVPLTALVRVLFWPCALVQKMAYVHIGKDVRHVIVVNNGLARNFKDRRLP